MDESSCSFKINLNLLINEIVTFHTSWIIRSEATGNYTIKVTAASVDEYMHNEHRRGMDVCKTQIVKGSPLIGELLITPTLFSPGLEPNMLYFQPGKGVTVKCNVTSILDVESVFIFYTTNSPDSWNQVEMKNVTWQLWTGTLLGQLRNKKMFFYIEATGPNNAKSKTDIYECMFLDIPLLERKTYTIKIVMSFVLVLGSLYIINFYRKRMKEI